ncbi:hypothetical protein VD0002_g9799 [Verticillium dahliae]|uniref:Uncharacterized protein n=1 Tax=Verticillium dahliae TaxID=27337 RepID=A0A2J8EG76_VERDA|nr:hypothetical protein BJF96_g7143 [Verticillium dahliae]PNH37004.1 hypothetical protein VD0004_g9769 [Verticillium dahliae]PNH41245.1 hypothetical protein VD0003_g9993 [Verticillium dahliae]PNH56416.1 hypothetical protein VD0002_g9799 [Verticillium dahliae]PNH60516.1 hypothetical protein VD0001_g9849 [Verticillium dahliae]
MGPVECLPMQLATLLGRPSVNPRSDSSLEVQ